jgi:hypothetical protein
MAATSQPIQGIETSWEKKLESLIACREGQLTIKFLRVVTGSFGGEARPVITIQLCGMRMSANTIKVESPETPIHHRSERRRITQCYM